LLVVDDDDDIREMIGLILGMKGYRTVGAEDGLVALDHIHEKGAPAGVLLDLRMPRMSGHEFAQALRRDPSVASIPIVVVSGDTHAFASGEIPGAIAFLKKPIEIDRLLEEVRKCFLHSSFDGLEKRVLR
jgi:CheY-like chemotaxis protein